MGLSPKARLHPYFWFRLHPYELASGNTAWNYRTHYYLVLSHKTYQNQGICYVTKNVCGPQYISSCESGPQH